MYFKANGKPFAFFDQIILFFEKKFTFISKFSNVILLLIDNVELSDVNLC